MTDTTARWKRWLARAKALGDAAGTNSVADLLAEVDAKLTALTEAQERDRAASADLASQDPAVTSAGVETLRAGQERVDELVGDLATRVADLQAAMDVAHAEIGNLAGRLDAGFAFDVDLGLDEDREQVVGAVTSLGQELKGQIDEVRSDLGQMMPHDDQRPAAPATAEMLADLRDELLNELVVVRRRLKVRADDGTMSDEQVDAIADAVARRLAENESAVSEVRRGPVGESTRRAAPLSANGPGPEPEGGWR